MEDFIRHVAAVAGDDDDDSISVVVAGPPQHHKNNDPRGRNEGPQHVGADASERESQHPNVCKCFIVSSHVRRCLCGILQEQASQDDCSHRVHGSVVTISVQAEQESLISSGLIRFI